MSLGFAPSMLLLGMLLYLDQSAAITRLAETSMLLLGMPDFLRSILQLRVEPAPSAATILR
jgi:hypothetical protein